MGSCFSSYLSTTNLVHERLLLPTAKVIGMDGSLMEYSQPVKVYEALGLSRLSCFLCSSDELLFDARIPALGSQESLELGQLYFMLPRAKLDYTLTATDMAALALKASSALMAVTTAEKRPRRERQTIRVMPVADQVDEGDDYDSSFISGHKNNFDGKKKSMDKRTISSSSPSSLRVGRTNRPMLLGTIEEAAE